MKISTDSKQRGSALLVVVFLGTMLSIMLASYMLLVRNQNTSVARSLSWNACIPVAEAGIEEAITQIYYNGVTNLSANGWTLSNGVYNKTRAIGSNYYSVTITTADPPVVTSVAAVALSSAASGGLVTTSKNPVYLRRTVQVTTRRDGAFVKAMVAKGQIDFNGNNIQTDSFDSTDPNYSTGGAYVSAKAKENGDVATNSGLVNSVNIGNANIFGRVATGPNGSIAIGPNGAVGTKAWQAVNHGIQPGWSSDDMNVSFPDIGVPYTTGTAPPANVKVGSTTYAYVLGTGNYIMSSLSLKSSDVLYVAGTANLYVTDNISISGKGQIQVASGSLVLYMGGASASISGNGIANDTGSALNFVYLGLPTNTSLSFSGNAAFVGAIYAPAADFNLSGGGNNILDFIGASVSNTVTMNGHFHFHYDEALGKSKWGRNYVIASWNEI